MDLLFFLITDISFYFLMSLPFDPMFSIKLLIGFPSLVDSYQSSIGRMLSSKVTVQPISRQLAGDILYGYHEKTVKKLTTGNNF